MNPSSIKSLYCVLVRYVLKYRSHHLSSVCGKRNCLSWASSKPISWCHCHVKKTLMVLLKLSTIISYIKANRIGTCSVLLQMSKLYLWTNLEYLTDNILYLISYNTLWIKYLIVFWFPLKTIYIFTISKRNKNKVWQINFYWVKHN